MTLLGQLKAHLWTKGAMRPPWDYVILVACRDLYHTVPSQVEAEKAVQILRHLRMAQMETGVSNPVQRKKTNG